MKCLLEFHDNTRIPNWLRNFYSCNILVNSICHVGFLLRLGRFHHCNLGGFVWWTQVQIGSQRFYFPCSLNKLAKRRRENTCFVFSKKSSDFLFFFILFSFAVYLFKVWLKIFQKQIHFFFYLCQFFLGAAYYVQNL